ncbi:MAG: proteasome ATPase, partial [Nitrospirales bacterium]
AIATDEKGLKMDDFSRAIREEYKEHEDLPNTTNPDDWAKIAGKKGEKIVNVRTLTAGSGESRRIETMGTGHYF